MEQDYRKPGYIKYNVGDIVRERDWIYLSSEPMYGLVVNIDRGVYRDLEWIPHVDDRLEVYWFKWKHSELLPAVFVEIVSRTETVIIKNLETNYEEKT